MGYEKFYGELFAPLKPLLGPIDRDTIVAIIGFDMGGPLNFCTIDSANGSGCITYVSCELAVREEQQPSKFGRFELLTSCDDEKWVRSIVSDIGRMTLDAAFGHGHTMDIGSWVEPDASLQGVVFEEVCDCQIAGEVFGVLRVIGITRAELEYAQLHGAASLLQSLRKAGVYPKTLVKRASVI